MAYTPDIANFQDVSVTAFLLHPLTLLSLRHRAISLFRTSYSIVAVARESVPDSLALLWLCQYAPSSSSYAPFYVASSEAPKPYTRYYSTPLCSQVSVPLYVYPKHCCKHSAVWCDALCWRLYVYSRSLEKKYLQENRDTLRH